MCPVRGFLVICICIDDSTGDTANFVFENTTRSTLDLDLQGVWMNDGVSFKA